MNETLETLINLRSKGARTVNSILGLGNTVPRKHKDKDNLNPQQRKRVEALKDKLNEPADDWSVEVWE